MSQTKFIVILKDFSEENHNVSLFKKEYLCHSFFMTSLPFHILSGNRGRTQI